MFMRGGNWGFIACMGATLLVACGGRTADRSGAAGTSDGGSPSSGGAGGVVIVPGGAGGTAGGGGAAGESPDPNRCHFDDTRGISTYETTGIVHPDAHLDARVAECQLRLRNSCGWLPGNDQLCFGGDGSNPVVWPDSVTGPEECVDGAGWYLDDPGFPTRIILCPATCDIINAAIADNLAIGNFSYPVLPEPEIPAPSAPPIEPACRDQVARTAEERIDWCEFRGAPDLRNPNLRMGGGERGYVNLTYVESPQRCCEVGEAWYVDGTEEDPHIHLCPTVCRHIEGGLPDDLYPNVEFNGSGGDCD